MYVRLYKKIFQVFFLGGGGGGGGWGWGWEGGEPLHKYMMIFRHFIFICFFSSPVHEVLMVSYCDRSFVRHPCVVNFLL